MEEISKIPRLPGDGAQDDTHFQDDSKAKQVSLNRSPSLHSSSDVTLSIEGETCLKLFFFIEKQTVYSTKTYFV